MTAMHICTLLWTILWIIWVLGWLRTKRAQERVPLGSRILYGIPVVTAFYLLFDKSIRLGWLEVSIFPHEIVIEVVAIALTAMGIAFAIWARFYLGQNWSSAVSIKVDHQLIRKGPYAWVRHPIYSGFLLAMVGTGMARREPRGIVAFALMWFGFWVKSRMEERFMRKTFGAEYEEYSRSTGGLIPKFRF